jgi:hypothetical protein
MAVMAVIGGEALFSTGRPCALARSWSSKSAQMRRLCQQSKHASAAQQLLMLSFSHEFLRLRQCFGNISKSETRAEQQ